MDEQHAARQATGMRRLASVACLADEGHAPANRPHEGAKRRSSIRSMRSRDAGEEALRTAYAHAEKLGKLIMEPRPEIARREWGRVRFDDGYTHVPFKVSGGARPVAAVAKFANESSVLKSCLATLVQVLCASRSMLFSASGKGGRGRSSITKLLLQYVDAPPESNVPVDSASLEAILQKACAEEDSAVRAADSLTSSLIVAPKPASDDSTIASYDAMVLCDAHWRTTMDCQLSNDVAHAMAFGYGKRTGSDSARQAHLAQSAMLRPCGSLTRSPACIDLFELGARHGVLPAW